MRPPNLSPADCCASLVAAWEQGPHPSQVQRRAAFMADVVGCGFQSLEARSLAQASDCASLGPEAADFLPVLQDTLMSNAALARRVASFL